MVQRAVEVADDRTDFADRLALAGLVATLEAGLCAAHALQRAGQQHRHRQRAGGQRQRHRAAGSGHTEMTAELGQQRLHRIQQAEGGEASQEQRQRGTPEGRRALLDTGLGSGVDSVGAAFDGRRGFASHGIDGPVGTAGRGRERAPD
ncbi:hypothetical protein G6F57_013664 [Rhizopus arrhizus]|nr:hypothetical protein G6F57_013664 [Rhizopus arrhizus]